jgi:hypothetical protein
MWFGLHVEFWLTCIGGKIVLLACFFDPWLLGTNNRLQLPWMGTVIISLPVLLVLALMYQVLHWGRTLKLACVHMI